MLEDENLDQETELLQESILMLIRTNREFIRLLAVVVNNSKFKNKLFGMEFNKAFADFNRAKNILETLKVFEDHISQ